MKSLKISILATRYYLMLNVAVGLGGSIGRYLKDGYLEFSTILEYVLIALFAYTIIIVFHFTLFKKAKKTPKPSGDLGV
ncbi:MAG: hypothetical protein ABJE63_10525 [Lentilitoribacter sp.]